MKTFRRHLFHHEGVTDIRKMREDAQESARKGEPVLLHLHPYEDLFDGCGPLTRINEPHQEYVPDTPTGGIAA